MMPNAVLDAHALMVYLEREEGYEKVLGYLTEALDHDSLSMTTVNVGEVLYIVRREHGEETMAEIEGVIESLPIKIVDVDMSLTRLAARLKAEGGISYADCFAAALAVREGVRLITGDREFKVLEGEVEVEWIR